MALPLPSMRSFAEHLNAPTGMGVLKNHPHTGAAGGAPCGDLVRIAVRIEGDRVSEAGFDADGCGALTAAASAIVESIEGRSFLSACLVEPDRLVKGLGLSPPSATPPSSPRTRFTGRSVSGPRMGP